MGPAVRRTRPQSRITAAPVQDPNYSGPKVGIACSAVHFGLKARLLGTEFLDAETGRQKSSRKSPNACRDQSPGSKWPEIPAESPYLASTREGVARGDWVVEAVGHKLVIHQPVIEPFSAASGREGFGRDEISEAIWNPRTITDCSYGWPSVAIC